MLKEPKRIIAEEPIAQEYSTIYLIMLKELKRIIAEEPIAQKYSQAILHWKRCCIVST